jgi:hypothetical protein
MVPELVKLGDETYDDIIIITIMSHVYAMHPVHVCRFINLYLQSEYSKYT